MGGCQWAGADRVGADRVGAYQTGRPYGRYIDDNWDEIAKWVHSKWVMRADDVTRSWRDASNALTDMVPVGALVQLAANLTYNPTRDKWGVVEVKTEVLWGRAYIGALLPDEENSEFPIVTRGENDSGGTIEVFDSYLAVISHRGSPVSSEVWYRWVLQAGYLDCVWALVRASPPTQVSDHITRTRAALHPTPDAALHSTPHATLNPTPHAALLPKCVWSGYRCL